MISEKSSGSSRNKIQIFGIRLLWPGWEAEIVFKSITSVCSVKSVIGLSTLSQGMGEKHLEFNLRPSSTAKR